MGDRGEAAVQAGRMHTGRVKFRVYILPSLTATHDIRRARAVEAGTRERKPPRGARADRPTAETLRNLGETIESDDRCQGAIDTSTSFSHCTF